MNPGPSVILSIIALTAAAHASPPLESLTVSGDIASLSELYWVGGRSDVSDPATVFAGGEGFDKSTAAYAVCPIDNSKAISHASSSALIIGDSLIVHGSCLSSVSNKGAVTAGNAGAAMNISYTINVPAGAVYLWTFADGWVSNTRAVVTLRKGDAFLFRSSPGEGDWTAFSGTLEAGQYVLDTSAFAYTDLAINGGPPQDALFDFTFVLTACPCLADFDLSGGTPDINDINAYFDAWLIGDASTDSDCSGGTPDASDVEAFFGQWLAGGC